MIYSSRDLLERDTYRMQKPSSSPLPEEILIIKLIRIYEGDEFQQPKKINANVKALKKRFGIIYLK